MEIIPWRAHHLFLVYLTEKDGSQSTIEYLISNYAGIRLRDDTKLFSYYQDVIGAIEGKQRKYTRQELSYGEQLKSTLEHFVTLSPQTMIQLITTGKDAICQLCAKGVHCNFSGGKNSTFGELIDDHKVISRLKEQLGGQLTINSNGAVISKESISQFIQSASGPEIIYCFMDY